MVDIGISCLICSTIVKLFQLPSPGSITHRMWVGQQTGTQFAYLIVWISRFPGDAGSQRRNASETTRFTTSQLTGSIQRSHVKRRWSDDNEEIQRWAYDCGQEACRQDGWWTRSHQEPQGRAKDNEDIKSRIPGAAAAPDVPAAPSPPHLRTSRASVPEEEPSIFLIPAR